MSTSSEEAGRRPTAETIAEDLTLANEFGESWGYGYDEGHEAIVIEMYGDKGEIAATFRATVTIEEVK